jgi:DNA repair ATPase RecN
VSAPVLVTAAPATTPPPAPAPPRPPEPEVRAGHPIDTVLAQADHIRTLQPAELAQEINRLGQPPDTSVRLMQLAMALAQSKSAANTARAHALVQQVQGRTDDESRALHPLARWAAAQLAELRRTEEQTERQAQQLRDAQRRIEQLNARLEAVRAIERSLPSLPASGASAPAPARP